MTNPMEDFMNEQNLERVLHMVLNNFEKTQKHKLTEDEKEYFMIMARRVFEEFAVTDARDIKVADEEQKEHLDDLLNRMVQSISGLMVYFIHSQLNNYVYQKRIDLLEGIIKDLDRE